LILCQIGSNFIQINNFQVVQFMATMKGNNKFSPLQIFVVVGSGIQNPRTGMKKIRIREKTSATLIRNPRFRSLTFVRCFHPVFRVLYCKHQDCLLSLYGEKSQMLRHSCGLIWVDHHHPNVHGLRLEVLNSPPHN
jgi:hypothetical protein